MRSTMGLLASLALVGGLAAGQSALAQGKCGAVTFTGAIISQFPEAGNACLEIVTREGKQYAHFKGEIVSVSGSQVRARFELPNGGYSKTYAFTPNPDARANIKGTRYRFRDLTKGQELDIYLPPDRWEFVVPETETLAAAPTLEVVQVTTVTTAAPAALPKTASPVPLLGLLSGMLALLGFGLLLARRGLR